MRPASALASFALAALFSVSALAQSGNPPRDDRHWSPPPGSINFSGNETPVASDMDADGRIVAAFNVIPNLSSSAGFVFVAEYDTLVANWIVVGGVLRFQITGARAIVAKTNGDFYVAGNFYEAVNPDGSTDDVSHIVRWDNATGRWDNLGGGLDGPVADLDQAPPGGEVCAAGSFLEGNNRGGSRTVLQRVGCWDGNQWNAVGGGVTADSPLANIAVAANGDIIVHGLQFGTLDSLTAQGVGRGGIARWSGGAWQSLDNGLNSFALSVTAGAGKEVVVSGLNVQAVTPTGTVTAPVLRFDGTTWTPFDQGLGGVANVYSVHASGDNTLFANTGREIFRRTSGDPSWVLIGNGQRSPISPFFTTAAAARGASDEFYVGGGFTSIENPPVAAVPSPNHARWDGSRWHAMLGNSTALPDDVVRASTSVGGSPYAAAFGGSFRTIGPLPIMKTSIFDGSGWRNLGNGISAPDSATVHAIVASNPFANGIAATLFVGGEFDEVLQPNGDAMSVANIAAFSRQADQWFSLGQGLDGPVYALAFWDGPAVDDAVLYVGGAFGVATNPDGSGIVVNGIARWLVSENRWEALGSGLTVNGGGDPPRVLAIDVARRLPTAPLGTEPHDHDVFVGGRFDGVLNSGGVGSPVAGSRNIAWFSAREGLWRATGGGADSTVRALKYVRHPVWPVDSAPHTFGRGVLYAGGDFRVVRQEPGGIVPANHIAKWRIDTNTWDILGETASANGFDGPVHSLTVHPTLTTARWLQRIALIVGGDFTTGVGSDGATITLNNIALIDDGEPLADHPESFARETFLPFGSGTDDVVRTTVALNCPETSGGETVYAGGDFTTAGGKMVPALAKWRYSIDSEAVQLVVYNAGTTCPNCSSEIIGLQQTSVCEGTLSKAGAGADIDLFRGLDFGESAAVTPSVSREVPVGQPLSIEVRDGSGSLLATQDSVIVESRRPTMLIVSGVDDPQAYAANPDGRSTRLALRTALLPELDDDAAPGIAAVLFFNGATDAPSVDVVVDGNVVAEAIPFGEPNLEPIALQAGTHAIEMRRNSDGSVVRSWTSEIPDGHVTMVLKGFADPVANQNGPPLDLAVVDITSLIPVAVEEASPDVGDTGDRPAAELGPNYPNPFLNATTIEYHVTTPTKVRLTVYDSIGREVAVLVDGWVTSGRHEARFAPRRLPSGVYFVRLHTDTTRQTRVIVRAG